MDKLIEEKIMTKQFNIDKKDSPRPLSTLWPNQFDVLNEIIS